MKHVGIISVTDICVGDNQLLSRGNRLIIIHSYIALTILFFDFVRSYVSYYVIQRIEIVTPISPEMIWSSIKEMRGKPVLPKSYKYNCCNPLRINILVEY